MKMTIEQWAGVEDWAFDEDERERCEADHRDGGVCQRLLTPAGNCPGKADHAEPVT